MSGSFSKSVYTIRIFARIGIKRFFRDKLAIFFTVLFPLIFLFIFGSFSKNNDLSFHIALINQSKTSFAEYFAKDMSQSKTFKIDPNINSLDQAKEKMSRSEIDAAVVIPPDFGTVKAGTNKPTGQAIIYYDSNNIQAAKSIETVLDGEFEHFNSHLVMTPTPFMARTESTNNQALTKFDYTFAGILGFAIVGLGIFGPVNYFPEMKKQGILRRLHTTTLKTWQYFISNVLSNSVVGLFSISIMFIAAYTVFDFRMRGSVIELALFIIMGILCIFGIGLAIGGWAKNENQAAPLANIIVFPMLFLSGTFFPRFQMPEWLQHVSAYLPLTPIIDGIRMIATEGKHLWEIGPQLGLIAIWTIIIYAIAFRVFRWE
jgi:ABC-2 type transport system permease protein